MEYAGLIYNFIIGIVSLCGGLMFTWWWLVIGKASDVYHYTTAVLYGIVISCVVNILVLHIIFHESEHMHAADIAKQWWFIFRAAPEHIAVVCIVVAMAKRTIRILKNSRKKKEPLPEKTSLEVVSSLKADLFSDSGEEEGR